MSEKEVHELGIQPITCFAFNKERTSEYLCRTFRQFVSGIQFSKNPNLYI